MPAATKQIAKRLRATRKAFHLTQAQLCRWTGISPRAWSCAETGNARIGIDNALSLQRVFGTSLDWIYFGERTTRPLARLPRRLRA